MKWFKHDSGAHRDAKLKKVIMKYRANGYALYWYCIELIAGDLDKDNITFELEHDAEIIGYELGIDSALVQEIMMYMVSLKLFDINAETNRIVCIKLANRLDESASKNPEIRRVVNQARKTGLVGVKNDGFVYLIESSGLYKIGKTVNLHKRLADYKTTNPLASLLHTIESVDPSLLESSLHKHFSDKRTDGEWFKLNKSDVDAILRIDDGDIFIREGFRKVSGMFPEDSGKIQSDSGADKIRLDKNRLDKNKEEKPSGRFTPPTIQEIASYCSERKNTVDPDKFFDFYEASGWMRGKSKIKDWKACVRTWEEKQKQAQQQIIPNRRAMPKAGTVQ